MACSRSRNRTCSVTLAVLIAASCLVSAAAAENLPLPSEQEVLKRLARVARLYRDNALRFTCDETIFKTGFGRSSIHKYKYIYRVSDDGERLLDYRAPRGRVEARSQERQQRANLRDAGLPSYVLRAYSWVFVFSDEHQPRHAYRVEGWDEKYGRRAIRIAFRGRPPLQPGVNVWTGTALVDARTWQLLYVEAIHSDDLEEYELQQLRLESPDDPRVEHRRAFRYSTVETEFDVEKNGLRFPGRVMIRRARHWVKNRGVREGTPEFIVIHTYKRYRFFGVRTAEQITDVVLGS